MKDRAMSKEDFDQLQKARARIDNMVTAKQIDKLITNSEIEVNKKFDNCVVVTCKLPSGFVIVESSACFDPADYDQEQGIKNCMERIRAKIRELEKYRFQANYGDGLYAGGLAEERERILELISIYGFSLKEAESFVMRYY